MFYCIATGCKNNARRRRDLAFYRPPKDKELLTRWLVNLRLRFLPQSAENCAVCAEHFEPDCFGRDLRAELLGGRSRPPLLKDAVPTLFLHNDFKANEKRRIYSEERKKRKEKEEILKDLLGSYYYMKPAPLDKQNNPSEGGEQDDKFSIRSLLSGFGGPAAQDILANTDNDQTRSGANNDVGKAQQTRSGSDGDVSSAHEQTRSGTGSDVSTSLDQTRTGHDQAPYLTAEKSTPDKQCQTAKSSKSIVICKLLFTKAISCQTDENPTAEISCQAKPSMVTTETQWDEKDFLPNPELVQRDHSYCASAVSTERQRSEQRKRKHSSRK